MKHKESKDKKHEKPVGLRRNSRALKALSAIANGTLAVGAAMAEVGAQGYPSVSKTLWRQAHGKSIKAPTVDFERLLCDAQERSRYRRAVWSLQERRFVRRVRRNGKPVLIITEEGKRRLRSASMHNLRIPSPERWDGKWRIILFDVPEKRKHSRDSLRRYLQNLGFYQLQKSAFVYPYPCADELDVVIQNLNLAPYVTFFTTKELGYQEAKALYRFKLERNFKPKKS